MPDPVMADEVAECPRCCALVRHGALVNHMRFHDGLPALLDDAEDRGVAQPPEMVRFEGPVAWLNTPTRDGRVIRSLTVPRLPFSVLVYNRGHDSQLVGKVTEVTFSGDVVIARGEIAAGMMWDDQGRIPCGVDIFPDVETTEWDGGRVWVSGSLLSLAVYVVGEWSAFPDAHIRRVDDPI